MNELGRQVRDLLSALGIRHRRYSGRWMFGAVCVAVTYNNEGGFGDMWSGPAPIKER